MKDVTINSKGEATITLGWHELQAIAIACAHTYHHPNASAFPPGRIQLHVMQRLATPLGIIGDSARKLSIIQAHEESIGKDTMYREEE